MSHEYDFTNPSQLQVRKLLLIEKDRLSTVGTLTFPESDEEIVWKVSCYFDFNTRAEYKILEQLNEMLEWCPHFTKCYGMQVLDVHPRIREHPRTGLPFDISLLKKETPKKTKKKNNKKPNKKKNGVCGEPSPGKGKVDSPEKGSAEKGSAEKSGKERNVKWCKNEFMFQEYIDSPFGSVRKFLTENQPDNGTIYSIMQQVSMTLLFSQEYCNFTHYDLHSDNVLVRDTNYPHKLYIPTGDGKPLYLKTFGVEPVIIDTGYSYSSAIDGSTLDMCTHNIHLGYTTHTFDKHYDLRMWLLNLIEDYPNGEKENATKLEGYFKKFKEVYRKHHMTPHGWFRSERDMDGINTHITDIVEKAAPARSILRSKTSDALLCIGHLLTLPLDQSGEEGDEKKFEKELKRLWGVISKNFWTCENKLGTGVNLRMYFWKCVIDLCAKEKSLFKVGCLEFMSLYSLSVTEGSVNFDELYDSLHIFADMYKTLIFEFYERIHEVRQKENTFTKTPEEIVKLMEYVYRSSHKIQVGEIVRVHSMKHRKSLDLLLTPEQLVRANEMKACPRAVYLAEIVETMQ